MVFLPFLRLEKPFFGKNVPVSPKNRYCSADTPFWYKKHRYTADLKSREGCVRYSIVFSWTLGQNCHFMPFLVSNLPKIASGQL